MSTSLPPAWRVTLLGGLALRGHGTEVTRLPSRAVTVLLARLALAPRRAHAREELIEAMWPGVDLDTGRNRLRQALSTLKSLLEPAGSAHARPVLQADRTSVRVVDGSLWCDAVEFERLARGGTPRDARALYAGDLLPGFYDAWIDDERARLAALHDRLNDDDGEDSDDADDPPPRPRAPSPPHAANPAAPAHAPAARVLLPSYVSRMFGAETQARLLRDRVLAARLVTLLGPGGAGKSRLAIEVAHSLRDHAAWPVAAPAPEEPFDLIAFVPLVACTTDTQVLDAIVTALGLVPGADAPLAAIVSALADRRALLVLDNFEQLVGTAEPMVSVLTSRLPRLHVLVTSRRALGIDGEQEVQHPALPLPPEDATLEQASANPAVALFVERARAVRSDFHLSARNAATLVALVGALEGMPLAIELAAARVRSVAPAEMLARLRGPGTPHLDLLARSGQRSATDTRHASMQRVIEWSWERLDAAQARLLTALTVFSGPFSAQAASILVEHEAIDALLGLDDLVAHSLVQTQGDDARRFSIYQPVREFVLARLRDWAGRWATTLPVTPSLPEARAEMPNLVAALGAARIDGANAAAAQLLIDLRSVLEDMALPSEGLELACDLVDHCDDPVLQARAHAVLAPALFTAGQRKAALQHAELALRRDLLQGPQLARALHAYARVRWRMFRRPDEVASLIDEAMPLAAGDLDIEASLFALRAFIHNQHFNDAAEGERLHGEALKRWEERGNRLAVLSGRYNLAVVAELANRWRLCLERIEPVIDEARDLQDWRRLSQSLNLRGNALTDLRRWRDAHADYQQCLRVAWQTMATYDIAFGLWNLPRVLMRLGRAESAVRLCAFAALFWTTRFGELAAGDRRYLVRIRRLATRSLAAAHLDALWREGEAMTLSQALAVAFTPVDD